jgi:hypothetical protein
MKRFYVFPIHFAISLRNGSGQILMDAAGTASFYLDAIVVSYPFELIHHGFWQLYLLIIGTPHPAYILIQSRVILVKAANRKRALLLTDLFLDGIDNSSPDVPIA